MTRIGELEVSALCLGGNVFGWNIDEAQSFAVLDAFAAAGGNFIDTADSYPPHSTGEAIGASERIIGAWMESRGNRDEMVIATKVGVMSGNMGLSAQQVRAGAEGSLRRLRTDRIDLYYAHVDVADPQLAEFDIDQSTPLEETLAAFDALVRDGLVREIGSSNYSPERLAEAMSIIDREGFARYAAVQPEYNLVERGYEHGLRDICLREGIGCVPYFSLALGFLTGKYRPGASIDSIRSGRASAYLEQERGPLVLDALDEIAAAHEVTLAAVALAWLAAQPTVVAPLSSARTPEQLDDLLQFTKLRLDDDELRRLDAASAV